MNYEKKYKEALEWARKVMQGEVGFVLDEVLEKFPELAESEDERMIKFIKQQLFNIKKTITENYKLDAKLTKAIDWLEKQVNKEQDERYKHLEDLLVADNIYQMAMNDAMGEEAKNKAIEALSNLAISKLLGLEKQGEQKPADKVEPKFKVGDIIKPKDRGHEPWQIMQVDILDKKYRFKDGYVIPFSQEDNYELIEQKPAWSEEDESILLRTINDLKFLKDTVSIDPSYAINIIDMEREINWLKSLKGRHTWKPSDARFKETNGGIRV